MRSKIRKSFLSTKSSARAAFHQFLSVSAFGRIWLLYDGAALVGYIILTIGFRFEFRGHDAFIDELYIVPEHRSRGYGRQAMAFVEQEAREMAVNAIHLEVDPGNDSALELYPPNRLYRSRPLLNDQMAGA